MRCLYGGQIASCLTCKNPFNYSVESSLAFISRLSPGVFGDSREKEGKKRDGEEGGREGRVDGWEGADVSSKALLPNY